MEIHRLGHALGAEVTGLALARPLPQSVLAILRDTWRKHLVVCFRGQQLQAGELLGFAQQFSDGDLALPRPGDTGISSELGLAGRWDGYKDGHNWHSDKSFTTCPTAATVLYCMASPAVGGDTIFANMYLAYESLTTRLRGVLEGLFAIHVRELPLRDIYCGSEGHDYVRGEIGLAELRIAELSEAAVHPVVRVHPETGRKALFINSRVARFDGMTEAESRPLLEFLQNRSTSYELTYRHRWSVGDVILWDNRCLQHIALCDYDVQRDERRMLRCVIPGTP